MKDVLKNIRAGLRTLVALPVAVSVVALAAVQGFIVGPLTGNDKIIPKIIYGALQHTLGYKIVFNKASAPQVKDKPTWFIANHMSLGDFVVLGAKLQGTFAGKGDILRWPVIAPLARAVSFIGLRRSKEYNEQSRGKIVQNFNEGHNTIMFPEGTTTDGEKVGLFRAALPSLLYGGENGKARDKKGAEITLEKDVVVQPVAIRVVRAGGEDAVGEKKDSVRNIYSLFNEQSIAKTFWTHMKESRITIELTLFPPMNPADYADAMELSNKAALQIASVVNPGQTTFEKAAIPGKADDGAVKAATATVKKADNFSL
jgi:1-acyl-sn-glycerol-3-phosphate acyltransferase